MEWARRRPNALSISLQAKQSLLGWHQAEELESRAEDEVLLNE